MIERKDNDLHMREDKSLGLTFAIEKLSLALKNLALVTELSSLLFIFLFL